MQCDKINPILLFLSFSRDMPHPKHCFVEILQRALKNRIYIVDIVVTETYVHHYNYASVYCPASLMS